MNTLNWISLILHLPKFLNSVSTLGESRILNLFTSPSIFLRGTNGQSDLIPSLSANLVKWTEIRWDLLFSTYAWLLMVISGLAISYANLLLLNHSLTTDSLQQIFSDKRTFWFTSALKRFRLWAEITWSRDTSLSILLDLWTSLVTVSSPIQRSWMKD